MQQRPRQPTIALRTGKRRWKEPKPSATAEGHISRSHLAVNNYGWQRKWLFCVQNNTNVITFSPAFSLLIQQEGWAASQGYIALPLHPSEATRVPAGWLHSATGPLGH